MTTSKAKASNTTTDALSATGKVINNILLDTYLSTSGVLFNVAEDKKGDGKPAMTGNIEVEGEELQMSGFKEVAESGRPYLSLSLGSENCTHYHGKLFRSEIKRSNKSPDFSGFITVLPCDRKEQYTNDEWDDAPVLKVTGWAKRNADGSPRIALTIAPETVMENELPI